MIYLWYFSTSFYLTVLLALLAVFGDYAVIHSNIRIYQAVFDNATHAIVGGMSWCIVSLRFKPHMTFLAIMEIAACTVVSSFIDVDHFLIARSLQLKDATSLKNRPPLHCSTFPVSICFLLLLLSYVLQDSSLKRIALIILTAFLSHHTRDATRRGYWLFPYGSTPPVPYGLYIMLTCGLPYFICYLHEFVTISHNRNVNDSVV